MFSSLGRAALKQVRQLSTEKKHMTFIDMAKKDGVQSLLGDFKPSPGFERCLKTMKIESLDKGTAMCSMKVDETMMNAFKTLHGGAICTIVDIVGTLAILCDERNNGQKPGVSVEINTSFVSPARMDEIIELEGRVLKSGKTLAFTEVDIRGRESGKLIATGRHTKFL